jgi:2-dehydropantoate 2-reductase
MSIERIVIVGAGAIGGTIGGYLAKSCLPVTLVACGEHGRVIREQGLKILHPYEPFLAQPDSVESISDVQWKPNDLVILATKLNDAESALDTLKQFTHTSTPVVCATNGVQAEAWAGSRFETVISMMIWMPTTYLNAGEVSVYGHPVLGVLDCGPIEVNSESLKLSSDFCQLLRQAGFDSESRSDISSWKRAKWITNLANTAQALVTDDWKSIAKIAQREGKTVLQKAALETVSKDELRERIANVTLLPIDGVEREGGSTWQSLTRGKPLETPWLEGAIVELGKQVGVATPVNQVLNDAAIRLRRLTSAEVLTLANAITESA